MLERLIENWLTNVNELGYQIPLCQLLCSEGHSILYVSRHSQGEHGVDILSRNLDGDVYAFQLKGGDITLSGQIDWERIICWTWGFSAR